jgi:cutinase
MTVIYARGTGEIGNVGTVTGPPLFKALREKMGADRVTCQGVDYAASAGVSTTSTI